ncbi:zinc finger protein 853 [Anopheles ziemanni]|uniref:zinc finger protein 853 n=1 Tax=Anopheles coustani TaxID=139045 RepID=UPI00265A20B0|nr:zinc finger protein 853 [Anopheles coustani]XP_058177190.1 zinc finger protein 853 [Anopheles ziemanni]
MPKPHARDQVCPMILAYHGSLPDNEPLETQSMFQFQHWDKCLRESQSYHCDEYSRIVFVSVIALKIDALDFHLIHRRCSRTTDLMTMADGSYDPMGHIQTGRPHAYYLCQAAAVALEQQQQQEQHHHRHHHQQQQQQQQQQQEHSNPVRSRPSSDDGHENNNNLPAAANNNLFCSEQKKHKRKRLSAVLDKLHNGGTVVNHNNNNVGEGQPFKVKCGDSRSSAEDSAEDSVFPYSASPRISVSPLRLSEVDENVPQQMTKKVQRAQHQALPVGGHDQQLPSPSQQHQAKLNALQQAMVPLQPSHNKQDDSQSMYKQLQYFNPLALFNYLPEPTKLLYQEFAARQRSHSDSDLQQQQQLEQQKLQQLDQRSLQSPTQAGPKKKRASHGSAGTGGRGSQKRPQAASRRNSNASSSSGSAPLDPQEHPLDLSMKSTGSGSRPSLHAESPTLLTTVIKEEPVIKDESPPPPPMPGSPFPSGMIVKREHFPELRQSPAFEHLTNGAGLSVVPSMTGPGGFNLNVSPVVEAMPPGSDVAYMCPVCGQLFSLQDRLAKHMASRHKSRTGATDITKSYMCEVCQRSFARSDMLTRHMRLHTGVKPYSCKVCGQIFSRSDHLSTHQRTHTGEKPYKCPQCPYAACRRDMITRHMRTHTRHEIQRGGGGGGGGSNGGSTSPLMDQKSLLLPLVNLSTGRGLKKEGAFGGVSANYALEATTES